MHFQEFVETLELDYATRTRTGTRLPRSEVKRRGYILGHGWTMLFPRYPLSQDLICLLQSWKGFNNRQPTFGAGNRLLHAQTRPPTSPFATPMDDHPDVAEPVSRHIR